MGESKGPTPMGPALALDTEAHQVGETQHTAP